MANYLVTGGAGFIGSHIVAELLARGEAVRVVDNLSTGHRRNLTDVAGHIDFLAGDLCDPSVCRAACADMDYVLHQAAIPSVPRSIAEPVSTTLNNVMGTVQLLDAARAAGVRRLVFAASSAAYGDLPDPIKHEGLPVQPMSPYAAAKVAGEAYCQAYARSLGLETVCLRYFNVFGPRQDPTSQYSAVIPKFITAVLAGRAPVLYGDGTQSRDFVYVANVADANVRAATASTPVAGCVINIASGTAFSLLDLLDSLRHILGCAITPVFTDRVAGDVRHSQADIRRAVALLDYRVTVDFPTGLARTAAWYRDGMGSAT